MISEEFIKTELETLAADLIQVVEEIDKRKADREEWLAEVAKLSTTEVDKASAAGIAVHRGLRRELHYILGRMGNVMDYIETPATGSMV